MEWKQSVESVLRNNAFITCSNDLIIWTTKDSYADSYAKEHGITVKYIGETEEPEITSTPKPTEAPSTPPTQTPDNTPTQKPDSSTDTITTPVSPHPTAQAQTTPQSPGQDVNITPVPEQPSASGPAIKGKVKATVGNRKLTLAWKKSSKCLRI